LSPPVVYLIVCGAGPAADIPTFLNLANQAGWTVCVTATPHGAELMDVAQVSNLVEYPVRLDYEKPLPPWPPPDIVLVAPATINSVNKFAAGIADSVALGLLTELFGVDLPVVIAPNVNPALARHPRFRKSIEELRAWGVHILFDPSAPPPTWMASWRTILDTCSLLLAHPELARKPAP
jgi:phosphopantothenoylcysteine synthetase/decarboxylase